MLELNPNSIKNYGGILFDYKLQGIDTSFQWQKLVMEVKDNAIKKNFPEIFNLKHPLNQDVLELTFDTLDKQCSGFAINKNPIFMMKFGKEIEAKCDKNIPLIQNLSDFLSEIKANTKPFQIDKEALDETKRNDFFGLNNIFIEKCGTITNGQDNLERIKSEFPLKKVYNFENAQNTTIEILNSIKNMMMEYFS